MPTEGRPLASYRTWGRDAIFWKVCFRSKVPNSFRKMDELIDKRWAYKVIINIQYILKDEKTERRVCG